MAAGRSRENAFTAAMSLLAGVEAPSGTPQTSEEIVRVIYALAQDLRAETLLRVGEPGGIENDPASEGASPRSRRASPWVCLRAF
jgi:hypothetical protein